MILAVAVTLPPSACIRARHGRAFEAEKRVPVALAHEAVPGLRQELRSSLSHL